MIAGFGQGGEIQLADAKDQLAQDGKVKMLTLNGKRFDYGSNRGYMNAVLHLADRRKTGLSQIYMLPMVSADEQDRLKFILAQICETLSCFTEWCR